VTYQLFAVQNQGYKINEIKLLTNGHWLLIIPTKAHLGKHMEAFMGTGTNRPNSGQLPEGPRRPEAQISI
jgi:hypothetical protein